MGQIGRFAGGLGVLRDRFQLAIRVSSRRTRDLVRQLPTVEPCPPKNTREQEVPAWEARYTLDSGGGMEAGCTLARSPIILSGFRRIVVRGDGRLCDDEASLATVHRAFVWRTPGRRLSR